MSNVVTSDLVYEGDGILMTGFLAGSPSDATRPAVILAHEAPGLDDHMRGRAVALATEGYIALALDLYGLPFDIEAAMERYEEAMATPGRVLRRAQAALDALTMQAGVDPNRIGVVGFCLGGIVALELARAGRPIKCAIGIHPGLARPAGSSDGDISASVLMIVGDSDPVVSAEDRARFCAEMRAKKADWQLQLLGGVGHTYTNPLIDALGRPGFAYDARAEKRAWNQARALLRETIQNHKS